MKKIKLDGKLSLNKETIAKLNDEQMNGVKGGLLSIWSCVNGGSRCCPDPGNSTPQNPDTCGSTGSYNWSCANG